MATRSRASRKATAGEVIVVDSDSDVSQPGTKRRATGSGSAVTDGKGAQSPNVVDVSSGDEEEEVEVVDVAVKAIFQPCELCNRAEGVRGLGCCHHSICLPCLRIHVQAQTKQAKPLALCPVPKCPSPVLSAMDLLMVLPLPDYDNYSKRQLDVFQRLMSQVKNAEAVCPRCDGLCSEGTNFLTSLFKRGQDNGKRKRGSPSTQAEPSSKDLAAQLTAPPKILNCPGCSLKFCPMCSPVLGPESINYFNVTRSGGTGAQAKGLKASLNNQRLLSSHGSYCPRMPLYRLHVLSAYTKDLLNEFMRERVGKKSSSSGSSSGRSSWTKGTGFGGSQSSKSSAAVTKAEQEALKRQQKWDLRFQDALAKWRTYVPSPNSPVTPELQAMLAGGFARSGPISTPLCLLLRLLLRNDSFLDLSSRRHLYITALDLLTDLSSHMLIAHLLTRPVDELEDDDAKTLEQEGKGKASAAGAGSSSSNSVDQSSLLGLLDKLKMAALYFQKCGGKAQSTVTAEEEAGFLQDMALSIKISETHETITKRLNEHTMRWEKEIPSDESKAATCPSPSSPPLSTTALRSPTSTQDPKDRRPTRSMPTRSSPAAAAASAAGSSSSGSSSTHAGQAVAAGSASQGRTPAGAPSTSSSSSSGSGKGKRRGSSEEKEDEQEREAYAEVMGPLRFEAVNLLHMVESNEAAYTYYQEANGQDGVVGSAQKRLVRVMHEITSLATSLPVEYGAGIFVRVDEERPDVLKALISGPMDTPYANGLFEFDVWLPGSYPDSPPKVHLITTGGGRVRYNPNLYNSGKVCLSLLGTWAGPGWDPKRSTLLQVLVSIQSLILVSDPYFNEPGYEGQMSSAAGKAASEAYNAGVRHGTLRFALLEMMKKPSPVLKDVIERHFSLKRESILRQCEAWVKAAPLHVAGAGNSTGMAGNRAEVDKVAKEIVTLLGKMPST